jgi:hypothetical protein
MPVVAIRNHRREPVRMAPCGEPLPTGRKRRVTGQRLHRKIERQLRTDILAPWRLDLSAYDFSIERDYPEGTTLAGFFFERTEESLTATFTHRETGAELQVTEIWVNDDGEIIQWGTSYGRLTL